MSLVLEFVSAFTITLTIIYSWFKILDRKLTIKNYKLYLGLVLQTTISIIDHNFINQYIKMIITFISLIIFCKLLFNLNIKKTIILVCFSELIIIFSECLYVILRSFIKNFDLNYYINDDYIDYIVSLFTILICQLNFIKKIFNKISFIINNIEAKNIFFLCFILLISINYVFLVCYFSKNIILNLIINIIISIIYIIIFICILFSRYKYNKIFNKYNNSIIDLLSYEKIIENYKITMHEDSNSLKTIYSMTNDKKIKKYINALLKNKNISSDYLNDKLLLIPSGGLKGLLFSKITYMDDKDINYTFLFDKKICYNDFNKIDDMTIIDVCKILGVFIDNAIEEVQEYKDLKIEISFSKKYGSIEIIVKNSLKKNIVHDSIGKKRYTTKGKSHGYGLLLVNRIIKRNRRIFHEKIISKNFFEQKILIK